MRMPEGVEWRSLSWELGRSPVGTEEAQTNEFSEFHAIERAIYPHF
jgi:hypothetical protein